MQKAPLSPVIASAPSIHRLSGRVEGLASPKTGRPFSPAPLPPPKTNRAQGILIRPDSPEVALAFNVPNTPPHRLREDNDRFGFSSVKNTRAQLPFPLADDEETRHEICLDSIAPFTYILQIPGKNVRDMLIDAFNDWLHCSAESLSITKQVVGYLHTASLVIDDIEDESLTRRGQPAAHVVYGTAPALNAGNYVYFLALEKLLLLQSTECLQIFTAEMLNLHRGQGRDIFWRTSSYIASEEEYRQMVCDKTGGLFRLAIRVMQALSPNAEELMFSSKMSACSLDSAMEWPASPSSDCSPLRRLTSKSSFIFSQSSDFTVLADNLACYFQIRDDLINLASPTFHEKKGFCEDITEGKLSFIALHALRTLRAKGTTQSTKQAERLLHILKSKTENKSIIREALQLMEAAGSFKYTMAYLAALVVSIRSSIASLGGNSRLSRLLDTLTVEVDDCHDVADRVIKSS